MKPKSAYRLVRAGSRNLAIALVSLLAVSAAQGATLYWDGSATDWSAVGSWSSLVGSNLPGDNPLAIPGASDIATFSISMITNTAQTVNLNAAQSVAGLSFLGTNTAATTLLGGGTARTLTLGTSGITIAAGAGAVTLGDGTAANNVLLNLTSGAQTWTNSSANALTINDTAAAFTRVAGATLGFNKASTGNFLMSTTVLPNGNGIIGPWASFGTGTNTKYAYNNAGTLAGLSGTAAPTAVALTDTSGTANYDLAGATGTVPANVSANTIRYTGAALTTGATSLTIPGNAGMVSFMVNGLMNVGTGTWTVGGTSAGQQLTIGANRELVVNTANNGITVAAVVANNPFGASSLTVTGGSSNVLTLSSGSNTFTGGIVINGGHLAIAASDSTTAGGAAVLGAYPSSFQAANITLNNGGTLDANNGINVFQLNRGVYLGAGSETIQIQGNKSAYFYSVISGPGNLTFTATGNSSRAWFYAPMTYSGTTNTAGLGSGTMGFGNASSINSDGSLVNGSSMVLGCSAVWQNIGNTTYAGVISGSGSNNQIGSVPGGGLGNAAVALGDGYTASIQTAGRGILTLTGANTYTVGTVINSGGITLAGSGTLGNNANALWIGYGVLDLGTKNITQNAGVWLTDGTLKNGTLTSSGNFALNSAGTNGGFVASANLAGISTLTKTNAGKATLSGTNTYTGATTLTGGTVNLGSAETPGTSGPLGNPATIAGSIIFNGGTLQYSAANQYDYTNYNSSTNRFTTSGNNPYSIDTNGQTVSFANALVASGTSGLTKSGSGTLTLNGTDTYTGATTVNGGTLILAGSITGASNSALVLGGGTFSYAPSGTGNTQTMNGFSLNAGASAITATVTNTVALGALTARSAGGTIDFGATGTLTTTASNANGILGGYATVGGTNFATKSGSNVVALSSWDGANSTNDTTTSNNDVQTTGVTLAGNMTVNSLTISDTGNNALVVGTNNLTFTNGGGLLYAGNGSGGGTYSITGTTGIIGAGAANEFIVNVNSGAGLTISSQVIGSGAGILTKTGSGSLTITSAATNAYTGGTYVDAGTLTVNSYASNLTGLGTGAVAIAAGATLNIQSNGQAPTIANTFSGAGTLGLVFTSNNNITANNITGMTGTIHASRTDAFDGFHGAHIWTSNATGAVNAAVVLDAGTALSLNGSSPVTFPKGITVSGSLSTANSQSAILYNNTLNGNITLLTSVSFQSNTANSMVYVTGNITSGAGSGTQVLQMYSGFDNREIENFTGNISDGTTGGQISVAQNYHQNANLALLSGNNTYTGATYVMTGVLRANDGVGLPTNSNLTIAGPSAFETSANLVRPAGSGAGQMQLLQSTPSSFWTASGDGANTATATYNGFNAVINPVVVCFGTLGSPTSLTWGSGSFNPGTTGLYLNWTQNVGSYTYTSTIGSDIEFKNPIDLAGAARSVEVDYKTATMSGALSGTGSSGLTKIGAGTLLLSGDNSYAGATLVSAGKMILSGTNSGMSSAVGSMTIASGVTGQFNALNSIPGTSARTVTDTGMVLFGPDFGAGNIGSGLARLTTGSAGVVAADNQLGSSFDFNTAGLTAASLGVITSSTYTGTYTPNATAGYKLGGGGGTLTLSGTDALTGANTVSVTGNVVLAGLNNNVSGTTTVNASGTLTLGTGYAGQNGSVGGNMVDNGTSLTFNNFDNLTYNGAISGVGALNKLGVGTLTLGGTNTLTGAITATGGGTLVLSGNNSGSTSAVNIGATSNFTTFDTLRIVGDATAFPTGTLTLLAAATLELRNNSATDYNKALTLGGGTDTAATLKVDRADGTTSASGNVLTMGTVTVGTGKRLVVTGGNSYSARLKGFATSSGTGTIIPTTASVAIDTVSNVGGASTLYLDGTNTGENTVGAILTGGASQTVAKANISTWRMTGTNTYAGATSVYGGGTLVLDYSVTGTDTSKFADAAALNLGNAGTINVQNNPSGGTLTLKGGSYTETVGSTALNLGGTFLKRDGGDSKLQMQVLTRAAGGTIDFADATIATVSLANTNNIMGGYATLGGTDWAVGGLSNTAVTALPSGSYGAFPQTGGLTSDNDLLTGAQNQTGTVAINTLKIANSGNSQTLALGTNPLTFTYASAAALGGLLYVGGNDNLYTISGSGAGIIGAGAANEFIVNTNTGALTLDAPVIGNGAGTLTKTGAGTLVLNQASLYTGVTRVHQGVLRLMSATSSGTTGGGINVQNGAAVELANNITVGAEPINSLVGTGVSNGGALRNIASNSSTYGGAITLGEGGARINSDSGGALILTGGVVTGSSAGVVGGSAFSSTADLTIGGAGSTTVQTTAISGYGKVIKDGAGTLTLSAANTYTGATAITGGTLALSGSGSINTSKGITINGSGAQFLTGSSAAVVAPITLTQGTIGGSGTISTPVTIGANGILSPGNSPGSQSYTSGITWAGGGSYLWQVDQVDTANVAQTAYKGLDTGFDWLNVSGTLAISATPSSKFTIDINGLLHSTHALGAVGSWDSSKNYDWVIASATSAISGFDATAFTLSTTNFASGGNSLGAASFSLTQSSNDIVLHFAGSAITATNGKYQLTSTANGGSTATIIVGGSVGVATSLQNTGTGLQDALNGSGLAPTASGGTVTAGTAGSNSNLALSGTAASTGYSFSALTAGAYTISATSPTVANITAGGTPTADTPVTASVNVLDHASGSTVGSTLDLGNIHAGYTSAVTSNTVSATNASGTRVNLAGSAAAVGHLSLNSLSGITPGGSNNITAILATGQTVGVINQGFTYTFADNSVLSGASSNVGTASLTVTGNVYSGAGVWNMDGNGNWGDVVQWTTAGGAPGLDSDFSATDSATFASAATANNPTVTLNAVSPSLNNVTFNNSSKSYTLAASGGGTLVLNNGSSEATLTNTAGSHTLNTPITLASNVAVTVTAGTLTVGGNIGESASHTLTKSGAGTLALTGTNNNYSGGTSVTGGTLLVNNASGTGAGTGALSVGASATLGGSGSIGAATTIDGIHAPGDNGVGIQTFSNGLTYAAASHLQWQLNANSTSVRGTAFDGVDVSGGSFVITSGATLDLSFIGTVDFANNFWNATHSWTVADLGSSLTGDGGSSLFTLASYTSAPNYTTAQGSFSVSRVVDGNAKNDVVLTWQSPYDIWAAAKTLTGANNGLTQDPDNDGSNNLNEYASDTHPLNGTKGTVKYAAGSITAHGTPTLALAGSVASAVFARRLDRAAAGLTYTLQFSADLGEWVNSTHAIVAGDVVATDSVLDVVSVQFPTTITVAGGGTKVPKFFKVQVEKN